MAESMSSYYPGGASNPHVEMHVFDGGYFIEPKKDQSQAAVGYTPEISVPGDDRPVERTVGGMALVKTLADTYEL
ncbi:hypothetical protein KBD20_00015 [Candidatus Saccharibacteria bacterium]|nr:hypothetical protein [Candidatus Saccharibacteria bacterium]